jgi:8-oxo-dGTP pyrophosphatase MutT (NUDIX family)
VSPDPAGRPLPPNLPERFTDTATRLPDSMAEAVRGLADGSVTPAPAKPAATVVLLRDADAGIEAYLLRRTRSMAFAAGMTVFPGGTVDPRDSELPAEAFAGCDLNGWSRLLSADRALTAALVCAAVRETFEESGVLLAGTGPEDVVSDTATDDWEADRLALLDRSLSLAALLTRRRLVLRADLLRPWAHWITPELEPRRFDTRFFVAAMPAGQRTRDVGGEADRVSWQTPADALRAADTGAVELLPPTAFTLAELSTFATVAEVLAAGQSRDIRPVLPRIVVDGEAAQLLLPHDEPRP